MRLTTPILLGLVLAASAAQAAGPLGSERWRFPLAGPLVSQPAISAPGRIAVATARTLVVLTAEGRVEAKVDGVVPAQPFWAGEELWFRTSAGWLPWRSGVFGDVCAVQAVSGAADADGRPVFAVDGELVTCDPARKPLFQRRGRAGQVWAEADGWRVADDGVFDSFLSNGRYRAGAPVTQVGFPAGPGRSGEMIVSTPGGVLAAVDALLRPVWRGSGGVDGPPVTTRSGAVVLLSDRRLTLADPPFVSWALPVPAGVRAAIALDDGSIAVLERTGHLAIVREGRVTWTRALADSGNILAAHPSGALLVQDHGALVAIEAPPADRGARFPVALGVARASAPAKPSWRSRCPAPGPGRLLGGQLRVEGGAVVEAGTCAYPVIETRVSGSAGKKLFSTSCGESCRASAGDGRIVITIDGRIEAWDAKGRSKVIRANGPVLAGIGVDGARVQTITREQLGQAPLGDAVPFAGGLAGFDATGSIWIGGEDRPVKRLTLGPAPRVDAPRFVAFGGTLCAEGRGRAGCVIDGKVLPALSLEPRAAWFGDRIEACDRGRALCAVGEGLSYRRLRALDGPLRALHVMGDGTLAVLAGTRLSVLWPDGSERWGATLGESCEGEAWLSRPSRGVLAVRACGAVAAFATGLADRG